MKFQNYELDERFFTLDKGHKLQSQVLLNNISGQGFEKNLFEVHQVAHFNHEGSSGTFAFNKEGKSIPIESLVGINEHNINSMNPEMIKQAEKNMTKKQRKQFRKTMHINRLKQDVAAMTARKELIKDIAIKGGLDNMSADEKRTLSIRHNVPESKMEDIFNKEKNRVKKKIDFERKERAILDKYDGKKKTKEFLEQRNKAKNSYKSFYKTMEARTVINMMGMAPISAHMNVLPTIKGEPGYGLRTIQFLEELDDEMHQQKKGGGTPTRLQVSEKQYVKALDIVQKKDIGFVTEKAQDIRSRINKMSGKGKLATLAALGLKAGITHSIIDNDDDGVISTLVTSGIYAGLIGGAALLGREMLTKVDARKKKTSLWERQIKEFETQAHLEEKLHELKKKTRPDGTFKDEDRKEGIRKKDKQRKRETASQKINRLRKSSYDKVNGLMSHEERVLRTNKRIMKGGVMALGTIAVGGALSGLHGIKHNMDVDDMKDKQEFALEKRQKDRKNKQQELSYNNPAFGSIVFDMFEERTAHYRMGDEKFK